MHFTTHLTFQMRGNLLRHALRLPVPWFEKRQLGDILSRFNSLQPVQDLLAGGLISVGLDGVMALITLVIMLLYAPLLTGVAVISLTLFVDSVFLETIRGARAFKLFGQERERHALWQNAYADSANNNVRIQRAAIGGTAGSSLLSGAETLVIFLLGAEAVIHGRMTLGMLLAFQSYRGQFSSATLSLVNQFFKFRMLGLHLERLADAVHQDAEVGLDESRDRNRQLGGAIETSNLTFRYAEHEPWVLRNVTLSIRPGEFVAFVGPSGGGKSSLLKLLMGLYPSTEGEVLVDGIPLPTFGVRAFREQIGVVMQDDQLFAGTVADNIAFFDPEMEMDRVEEVAKFALLHDEILAMPMGYMTLVGDLGSTLSGGQQQRVLLARALYRRPKILFLDEGTANLDMLAERRIMQGFAALNMTRIVVAHRLAAIEGADRIFAVEAGAVRELQRETAGQPLHVVAAEAPEVSA
jgi:ATP-binding cassette subfamily B protein RaxB